MSKFPWGRVIEVFDYDFDGVKMEVTKYYEPKRDSHNQSIRGEYSTAVAYHCDEIGRSSDNLFDLLIHFIAYKQLGLNQHVLVAGISRALCIGEVPA
jgi:hypothetical protein